MVILDDKSLEFFLTSYKKIADPLTRCLVLRAVYDMMKKKLTTTQNFISVVQTIFSWESDVNIL